MLANISTERTFEMASRGKMLVKLALETSEIPTKPPDENMMQNFEAVPNFVQLSDNASSITLMEQSNNLDSSDIIDIFNDRVSQPSTSSVDAKMMDASDHSYSAIRTGALKLNLRRNLNPTYYDVNDLEDEDFSPEESSEYVSSGSEESQSSLESNSPIPSGGEIAKQSLSNTDCSPLKKGKKRLRKPENWKKSKAKLLKNSGKSYVSRMGKTVQERVMGPPCSDRCKLSCSTKFNENLRAKLFEEYWKLASLQRQRDFLGSCIEPLQLKYRRIFSSGEPRRQNCAFFLLNNEKRIRVCKTFIIRTLGISERTIRTVIKSRASGMWIVSGDKRGKHGKQKKIDKEILDSVRAHINSIPRIESHYLRAQTSREFIDGGLSIAEMHRHYEKERLSKNKVAANYATYARIFNVEFNIGFFVPRKDQCDICESYKNAVGTEKEELEKGYQLHQEEKKLSRDEKARDKENADEVGSKRVLATYDLQAVLPVPMGQTSAFFYKSRLNCYNLTVSEIKTDHTVCYFWHEGLGSRGPNEIGTCVLMFLEEVANSRPGADVIFYTDNCSGQQKNRFILAMYLYAVEKLQINSITHKFLIRGHTQNEGDAVHSTIEKSVKKAKKSGPIFVPDQYVSIIRNAKKKGNPFIVKELTFTDFVDLKLLCNEMAINYMKNINGDHVKLSQIKILRTVKESDVYFYKTSYKETNWQQVQIRILNTRSSGSREVKNNINRKPAYASKLPISLNKKTDLQSLLQSNIIPKFYEPFYNSIL